ncbi:MAG: hypothetical protein WAS50_04415 [Nitrospira sp.]
MAHWLIVALFCTAPLLSAAEGHAGPSDAPRTPHVVESFDQTAPDRLLRSLYDHAVAALQEYIEFEGRLPEDGDTQARAGQFRLKLFPQGKSRSEEHLSAEGSFGLSPDAEQQEFTLRFKSSKHPSRPLSSVTDDVI